MQLILEEGKNLQYALKHKASCRIFKKLIRNDFVFKIII